MKQKTIQFKQLLTFTILAGFLFGCNIEEEYVTKQYQQSRNLKIRYLKGKEAMLKGKILESKLTLSNKVDILSRTNIALSTNEGVIDYTKVLEVIDAEGNINYTFNILNHPEDSQTVFHNLVLNNTTIGTEEIFLLKYTSNTPIATITEFVGTVTTKGISSNTNPCDDSIDDINFQGDYPTGSDNGSATPVPTDNTPVNPTTPGSGTGNGGTNGGNSGNTFSDLPKFLCNTENCGFSTTSLSAMQAHYAPHGFTIILRRGFTNITNTNPCDPNGSIGIIDPEPKTPCEDLTSMINNEENKAALLTLQSKTGENEEYGYSVTKNPDNTYNAPTPSNSSVNNPDDIIMPIGGSNVGAFHTHPEAASNGVYPMFTDGDLNWLFWAAKNHDNNGFPKNYTEYVLTLTVPQGTFAIKIKDWTKFAAFRNSPAWKNFDMGQRGELKRLRENFDDLEPTSDFNSLTNALLEVLSNGDAGVGLFEASPDLSSWSELSLNPSSIVNFAAEPIKTPCN